MMKILCATIQYSNCCKTAARSVPTANCRLFWSLSISVAAGSPRGEVVEKVTCSEEELNALQWATLESYIRELNYRNGLIADKTQPGAPASIAAVGMSLASIPILAERQLVPRLLLAK